MSEAAAVVISKDLPTPSTKDDEAKKEEKWTR